MERDGEIVTLLSLGLTRAQTAERLGITERTVYRRLRDPQVRANLDAAIDMLRGLPRELVRLYRVLEDLRGSLRFLDAHDSEDHSLTVGEARKHLSQAVVWAEELVWLKEQVALEQEAHDSLTCACVLGEAA